MKYNNAQRRERFALARGFETSRLSKSEYARRHGLSINVLDYWIREAAREDSSALEAAFFEVQVTDSPVPEAKMPPRQPDLEVELPHGVKLRFFGAAVAK